MTVSLAAFLGARLDEAAARAWAVHDVGKCDALLYEEDMAAAAARTPDCDCGLPARVLREVEADRALLALAADVAEDAAEHGYDLPGGVHDGRDPDERARDEEVGGALVALMNDVLRIRAAKWSDHPDCRQEWAVQP